MNSKKWIIALIGTLLLAGCSSMGPPTIPRDRFDYNGAVANSWKEQTLLNIVRMRYVDLPVFLEVSQIISGYTLEGGVRMDGGWSSKNSVQGDFFSLGGSGKFTDRPTITYSPMTGTQFIKNLMIPIEPINVFLLIQAGWSAGTIFNLAVQSINGVNNQYGGSIFSRGGDPAFYRVVALIERLQRSNYIDMRVEREKDGSQGGVLFFQKNAPPEILAASRELRKILGLKADTDRFRITFGGLSRHDDEIAVKTRSMGQVLIYLSSFVEVPEAHLAEKRAIPPVTESPQTETSKIRPIRIVSGKERPAQAVVTVHYRDYWFWIDDRDLYSKATFTLINFLFAFSDTGSKEGMPLVTIPAG